MKVLCRIRGGVWAGSNRDGCFGPKILRVAGKKSLEQYIHMYVCVCVDREIDINVYVYIYDKMAILNYNNDLKIAHASLHKRNIPMFDHIIFFSMGHISNAIKN